MFGSRPNMGRRTVVTHRVVSEDENGTIDVA
jgi:hypothetical protein